LSNLQSVLWEKINLVLNNKIQKKSKKKKTKANVFVFLKDHTKTCVHYYIIFLVNNNNNTLTIITISCQVGYSSPAESGIMEDLGLSVAAVSTNYSNSPALSLFC